MSSSNTKGLYTKIFCALSLFLYMYRRNVSWTRPNFFKIKTNELVHGFFSLRKQKNILFANYKDLRLVFNIRCLEPPVQPHANNNKHYNLKKITNIFRNSCANIHLWQSMTNLTL